MNLDTSNTKTSHIFYIADALEILRKISCNSIQLIITSPPYWNAKDYKNKSQIGFNDSYNDYLVKIRKIFKRFVRLLYPDGKIALNIGNIYNFDLVDKRSFTVNLILDLWKILYSINDLNFMGTIYWQKTTSRNGAVLFGSYPFPSNFMISTALESIHIFRKKGKRKISKEIKEKSKISKNEFRNLRNQIWYINGISKKKHPAVFPNDLVKRLIKMYSFYGDTILDPFCGVGTTNIEALKLNRNSIGIDVKYSYIRIALKKLRELECDAKITVSKKFGGVKACLT